jgi:hypothetical protein
MTRDRFYLAECDFLPLSPLLRDRTGNSLHFTHEIVYLLRKLFLACLIIPAMS